MQRTIEFLKKHNELRVIDEPLDIDLEIPHVAYVEVRKENSKALLFTKPISKRLNKEFSTPVLMNVFGSFQKTKLLFGKDVEEIAAEIEKLLHMRPPEGFMGKVSMLGELFNLKNVFPKRLKKRGACQEIVYEGEEVDLYKLPVLKTWEEDGGPFITMGQVYTQSLDGKLQNLGMYRLQVYDDNTLGMHWQIHKDSSHFFDQYQEAGKKMPVSIGIGGDPLYIWCGQAPLPYGMFELMLYGFVKNEPAKLVKSLTNPVYIPHDCDFVIEGWVDPHKLKIEGPFGDHTGYYTLEEPYPVMDVTAITRKKDAVYQATVVGKPPLEDKYMGWGTERIFLPLLKTTAPDLIDYHMPENGVFHNLILAKMKPYYKGHAKQFMHAFWGVGQMSFVKHAIFVRDDAPKLTSYELISEYILNRITPKSILISEGVIDALDHSSDEALVGGKLGIDCTGAKLAAPQCQVIDDEELFAKIQNITDEVKALCQYKVNTKNPICVISVDKKRKQKELIEDLKVLKIHFAILVIVDHEKNDVENPYMLTWRVCNNIDAKRDIYLEDFIAVDATNKGSIDGFNREWPGDVECSMNVIEDLRKRNIIDIDDAFIKKFQL